MRNSITRQKRNTFASNLLKYLDGDVLSIKLFIAVVYGFYGRFHHMAKLQQ